MGLNAFFCQRSDEALKVLDLLKLVDDVLLHGLEHSMLEAKLCEFVA